MNYFEFIEKLSSSSPTPGGGGASSLVGAVGVALCSMVCNLTVGKQKYQEHESEILEVLEKANKLQNRLLELIKEDEENFLPLSKAYSLKSNTEEEKKIKEESMEKCLKLASKAPIEVLNISYEAIKLHERILGKTTILAISDIGVGVESLRASLLSAKLNILININSLKDIEYKQNLKNEIDEIVSDGIRICDKVYDEVLSIIDK